MKTYKITDEQIEQISVFLKHIDDAREQVASSGSLDDAASELEKSANAIYDVLNQVKKAPAESPSDRLGERLPQPRKQPSLADIAKKKGAKLY